MKKVIMLASVLIILSVIIGFTVKADDSKNDEEYYRYYTEYEIEPGDTLSGIAEKFMDKYPCIHDVYSLREYTNEIAEVNNLGTTKIISYQHLVIPYYSEELKTLDM